MNKYDILMTMDVDLWLSHEHSFLFVTLNEEAKTKIFNSDICEYHAWKGTSLRETAISRASMPVYERRNVFDNKIRFELDWCTGMVADINRYFQTVLMCGIDELDLYSYEDTPCTWSYD